MVISILNIAVGLVTLPLVSHHLLAYVAINLVALVPFLGVVVRRLHDINRRGWWCLVLLCPFFHLIIMLLLLVVLSVLKGTAGDNRFGPASN